LPAFSGKRRSSKHKVLALGKFGQLSPPELILERRSIKGALELMEAEMKELIEDIAKALVDKPEEVAVHAIEGEQTTVLELRVAPTDLGKVIGKQGRTARSIRTILGAAGMKMKKRFTLEILE
jgi:uncharacterized protein